MKTKIVNLICFFICCLPLSVSAQLNEKFTSPDVLYKEGREMFKQENYAASAPLLQKFVSQTKSEDERLMEAEYMLASVAYELQEIHCIELINDYLEKYPDTPYANRLYALLGSAYFFNEKYDEALAMLNSSDLELLSNEERDDMTYRKAISYLSVGNTNQAAIWFETLKGSSNRYSKDCSYYIGYIRYTQGRYNEALTTFLPLQKDAKYKSLVPYYIADIYLKNREYDKAFQTAQDYLSTHPNDGLRIGEMHRIQGEVYYHKQAYRNAIERFEEYIATEKEPQRSVLYMQGLSYYQVNVFSKAANALGEVVKVDDSLTQNAYLHLGLSYLQLKEKSKARMAFEQAAAMNTNMKVKEQAAYNYALCIHETSFSAFGESVTVFERFLNEFPNSIYTDKISDYLVDVYLNTRSYDAALKSIQRIEKPGTRIMEAKQKILFQLGTQSFANAAFPQAIENFNQSIAIGQYNRQIKADATYWRGESYYRIGHMHEAARDFTEYLKINQQTGTEMYALAHYGLGYTAFDRKDYNRALEWFGKYTRLEKGTNREALADAYNRMGDCHLHARNFDDAKLYYSQAEAKETSAGDYSFYQLALVSGLQKDYPGKVTLLNRLTGKYPSSPYLVNAIYEKGRSYVLMENNGQAITAFKELLDKYPASPVARKAAAEIGMLYYQDGNYDQAITAYKHVVEQYPGSEEARLALRDLKSIYIDLNRVDEFAALASSLPGNIRFDASEQDSLTYVAAERVYARNKKEQAKESFNKYLLSYPEGAFELNAHYYLSLIAKEQANPDDLLLHTAKILEYPDSQFSEEALVMRSEVLFNSGNYQEALAAYKQMKEKASNPDRRLLASIGVLRSAYSLQDDTETIHAATELLAESKLSPELRIEALYNRAKSYLRQNAEQAAMTDFRELAKDTRNSFGAEAKFRIAELLYTAGKYTEAEKELLQFIEQSTPHAYWLARGFILLSDVYVATGNELDARQYLLSLQQNYQAEDNIKDMIENRLKKLNK